MNVTGIEFFDELIEIHNEQISINYKYKKMRSLLERVCKELTSNDNIQFSNLFSRLNFVCDKKKLDKKNTYLINTLRINSNKVLHTNFLPTKEVYLQDLKSLSNVLSHFYSVSIPNELDLILPKKDHYTPKLRKEIKISRIRVEVTSYDMNYIYAFDEDNPTEDPIKIKHHIAGVNEEFNETVSSIWNGCQLNLIDVTVDENGLYLPTIIIIEPDYLIDVSSLAECIKEYGRHPLNFIKSKFEATKNTKHILLGNVANLFFDEIVNEKSSDPIVYKDIMKKSFQYAPFEFSTCTDIDERFFQDSQIQFLNIKNVVNNVFPLKNIDIDNGIIEPAFICEQLGLQGRLDFLQLKASNGKQFVIELKSGKAPFPETNFELIGINNQAQAFLYQIIIQKVLGVIFSNDFQTFIFYSKYTDSTANLRLTKAYMAEIKNILNIRNLIVANERNIANDNTITTPKIIIDSINPNTLITNNYQNPNFLNGFIIPQIKHFKSFFENAKEIELEYFFSFYSFVTKEHYISKVGDSDYNSTQGISSLWLSSLEEKNESGEILTDLIIVGNNANTDKPTIKLKIPKYENDFLPNFRQGDIVILYERNKPEDNVNNKQIFKGSIEILSQTEITIRIRYKQRNPSVLPLTSLYAVEHDYLDSSYNSFYRGLYSFLNANQDRKNLLLNQRKPQIDNTQTLIGDYSYHKGIKNEEINPIVLKAKQAMDYFLLIGPPGTGKTSIAIKSMVEEFLFKPSNNILLLSYTNRAVDEICDALDNVDGNPVYIRIGSELSCAQKHRKRLLEEVIKDCDNRAQVRKRINDHKIFVGTVSSISNKTELFKLIKFQVAIIDEASQILEPSLIGILSAKDATGGNAIEKFILVGDYKQLPAVVLQKEVDSVVLNPELNQIGLYNRRNSLFERLYSLNKENKKSSVWSMLHKQGRMHPDIALFPNYSFYNSQLESVPLSHQVSELEYRSFDKNNPFHKLLASKRIAFIPSKRHKADKTNKTNSYESKIARELVKNIYELYKASILEFSAEETVGIITPYRSQIALIKREIHELNIVELNNITVDTVERYQGSQRDIIIYSFSVNQYNQLDFLANYIEDEGQVIDRKLNVAITRARKQLFIIGNPSILDNNLTYYRLIEFIRSKSGFVKAEPEDFLNGDFVIEEPNTDIEIGDNIFTPDQSFTSTFDNLVIQPIKDNPRTHYPNLIYGNDHDYNRNNVIEYGRTNFDQGTIEHTPKDKVNLYCYYNMRKHYFSSIAIFKSFDEYLKINFLNCENRITFMDFGCGPLTSGLAFNQHFSMNSDFCFNYVGIDISNAMLMKASEFSQTRLFNNKTTFKFVNTLNDISNDYWDSLFTLSSVVILNCSYLFGNLSQDDVKRLAEIINGLIDRHSLNKYILIYQNSSLEKRNRTYNLFKKLVPSLKSINHPKTEIIKYKNDILSNYDKCENLYYELLSN